MVIKCDTRCVGHLFTDLAFHGGTTPMRNHLVNKYPNKISEGSQRTLDLFVTSRRCPADHTEEITRRIAEFIARDLWLISIVEGEGFRSLFDYTEPGNRVPSHTHIAKVCRKIYNTQKEKLKGEISQCKVCRFDYRYLDKWSCR